MANGSTAGVLAFVLRAFLIFSTMAPQPSQRVLREDGATTSRAASRGPATRKSLISSSSSRRWAGLVALAPSCPLAKKFYCCASGWPTSQAVAPNSTKLDTALASEPPAGTRRASAFFTVCPSASKVLRSPSPLLESITPASLSAINTHSDHLLGHRYQRWLLLALASAKRIWRTVVMARPKGLASGRRLLATSRTSVSILPSTDKVPRQRD